MSDNMYKSIPSGEHQHELTMLYISKTVDIPNTTINDLAYKYLEVRGELKKSFEDILNKKSGTHFLTD